MSLVQVLILLHSLPYSGSRYVSAQLVSTYDRGGGRRRRRHGNKEMIFATRRRRLNMRAKVIVGGGSAAAAAAAAALGEWKRRALSAAAG